jgi:hypothetical protein
LSVICTIGPYPKDILMTKDSMRTINRKLPPKGLDKFCASPVGDGRGPRTKLAQASTPKPRNDPRPMLEAGLRMYHDR